MYFTVVVLFILFIFLILLYKYYLPVFLVNNFYKLNFTNGLKLRLFLYVLFFPFTIFLSFFYYKGLIKRNIILNFKQFFKIFSLLLVLFFITSISLFYIKDTFFKPFQISGNSMYPNFYNKEFILTNKSFSYDRFDTIVFHLPNSSHFYIKRIVGLPGESIKYENGNFYIGNINGDNFKLLENDYISKSLSIPNSDIYIIPENSYFVVGDNIDNSTDSLDCFGKCELGDDYVFMNSDNIVGKAYFDFGYYNMKTKFNNNGLDTKPRFFNIN